MANKSPKAASRITLEDFTEVTLSAVARAIEARRDRPGKISGPILFGIIWWPEGGPLAAALNKAGIPEK